MKNKMNENALSNEALEIVTGGVDNTAQGGDFVQHICNSERCGGKMVAFQCFSGGRAICTECGAKITL